MSTYCYRNPLSVDGMFDFEFLKRLHKVEANNIYGHIPYWGESVVTEKFEQFLEDGLIKICSNYEVLQYLKITDIKEILFAYELKQTGKKQVLIDRIYENLLDDEIFVPEGYHSYIVRTEKGEKIFQKLKTLKEMEFANLIDGMVDAIEQGDISRAYHLMCKHEIKQPFQRGLFVGIGNNKRKFNKYGVDTTYWSTRLRKGLSDSETQKYLDYLYADGNTTMGALDVCFNMLGVGEYKQNAETEKYFERHSY